MFGKYAINLDLFYFSFKLSRSRLRELENESEKLDESFRAYLKKQRLEKTQFNEDIAKILQSYNIRKAILGQHTPVRRTLTFNFDKNIAHSFPNADLFAINKSNENDILNSGHSGVDDKFENPFRAYGKEIEPITLNNTNNLGEITKIDEICPIDAPPKEPIRDVQLDNEKMSRHSETMIPAILITDLNNNSKKNTQDLLSSIDMKKVSNPTIDKQSEQKMQLKSIKENSIKSLNLSIPNVGLKSTSIISETTNEFSDESSDAKHKRDEKQKIISRNDLLAELNINDENKSVNIVSEQENIFELNSPIDELHLERDDLISKLNRSHASISNWKENLGKSMYITTSSSDQQDSQSDGQISTGPPKSPSPNDSW